MKKKVGLLGGTFDPIHKGHIQLAEAAKKECRLTSLVFIPAAEPPHKDSRNITAFSHRVAMLSLVCSEYQGLTFSTVEEELPKPSYTVDTLRKLQVSETDDLSFYFIIGSDAFLDFHLWKSYKKILSDINLIIARRNCDILSDITDQLKRFGYSHINGEWKIPGKETSAIVLATVPIDCSATEIKEEIRSGKTAGRCLTDSVAEYIRKHNLYLNSDRATIAPHGKRMSERV